MSHVIVLSQMIKVRSVSRALHCSHPFALQDVVIVAAARTPVGSFRSSLASLSAPVLGAVAIRGALDRVSGKLQSNQIDEVYMGNVVGANVGQAPAAQSARDAGIPVTVPCTTINKVCASGNRTLFNMYMCIAMNRTESCNDRGSIDCTWSTECCGGWRFREYV